MVEQKMKKKNKNYIKSVYECQKIKAKTTERIEYKQKSTYDVGLHCGIPLTLI